MIHESVRSLNETTLILLRPMDARDTLPRFARAMHQVVP
jgi:hypothetical protein